MLAVTKTLLNLRDAALAAADKDADSAITSAQVDVWINEALRSLWVRLIPIARDELVKAVNFTLTSPANTYTPSALFDFFAVRGVGVNYGSGKYTRLRMFRFGRRGAVGRLTYRVSGLDSNGGVIEFQPSELASAWPLQLLYIRNPSVKVHGSGVNLNHILVNDDDTVALPFGGDTYIEEHAAMRLRGGRFEEDPAFHANALKMAWDDVRASVSGGSQGPAPFPDDWSDDDNDGGFW